MSAMPKAVCFDLDGTLYNTRRVAWRMLLTMPGRLRFLARYRRVRQALRTEIFEDGPAFQRAELERLALALGREQEETARRLHQVHDVELARLLRRVGPYPDARPLLEGLRAHGVPLAVLSDLPVEAKLEALGLADLEYGVLLDAGTTGALKPHPRSFEQVAAALGVELSELVHVGDRHDTDVSGAEACGAQAVWLTRRPRLPVAPGTLVVSSLAELGQRWGLRTPS